MICTCLSAHMPSSLWHTTLSGPLTFWNPHDNLVTCSFVRVLSCMAYVPQLVCVYYIICLRVCMCVCVCKPVGHTGLCVDPRAHLVWSDFLPAGWCGTVAQMLKRLQLPTVFQGEASRPFRKINTNGRICTAHTGPFRSIRSPPQRQSLFFF